MSEIIVLEGNSLETLKDLPENSVDSVVTDPPYGLSFMGKKWDYDVPSTELWREVFRVLKPGGFLLSFGGTRTYHRMVVNIEDAGFEIRDQIMWIYGSGFPKSQNVALAIDKQAGAIGHRGKAFNTSGAGSRQKDLEGTNGHGEPAYKDAVTDDAKQWQGWGTALKPANEPIVVARKPLSESTVAKNVLRWGTGALNIDGSRIAGDLEQRTRFNGGGRKDENVGAFGVNESVHAAPANTQGRWPANVLFDEEAAAVLDEQSGHLGARGNANPSAHKDEGMFGNGIERRNDGFARDSGGASRFFYVAKASKRERNAGLEAAAATVTTDGRLSSIDNPFLRGETERLNHHPTVKPVKLMEYLIKLVTPADGIVLDPFVGSGTTLVAAKNLGFSGIGIEREPEYVKIALKRTGS